MGKERERMYQSILCEVMRNCSENLEWDNGRDERLDMYMRRLQFKGQNENERYTILKKACNKYDKLRQNRRSTELRLKKKNSWYIKDGVGETVKFVNVTPNHEKPFIYSWITWHTEFVSCIDHSRTRFSATSGPIWIF